MKALLTLDNGFRFPADLTFKRGAKLPKFHEQLEREIVKLWNQSQPNMVHKVIKCHLMRN